MLTPDNIWVIGITRELSTRDYYLVLYNDIRGVMDRVMRISKDVQFMPYTDFDEIEEIGSGRYGTVYSAKHRVDRYLMHGQDRVALKCFKNFDQASELFISEVSNPNIVNSNLQVIFNWIFTSYFIAQESRQVYISLFLKYTELGDKRIHDRDAIC